MQRTRQCVQLRERQSAHHELVSEHNVRDRPSVIRAERREGVHDLRGDILPRSAQSPPRGCGRVQLWAPDALLKIDHAGQFVSCKALREQRVVAGQAQSCEAAVWQKLHHRIRVRQVGEPNIIGFG